MSGFCNGPTDLATSFNSVGRMMGLQLGSRKETLLDISTFLRHLIAGNLENKLELARYSKNSPILFNMYTTMPAGAEEV